jgi:hypothetical protein
LYLFQKVDGRLQPEPLQPTFFVPMMGQAEAERDVLPQGGAPKLLNGDFSRTERGLPVGWYYVRQGRVEPSGRAPEENCLSLQNRTPGRAAMAIQAFGVDGRETQVVEISAWVRGRSVRPGQLPGQRPSLAVSFFNSDRETVQRQGIGPWSGTFSWVHQQQRIRIPAATRLASVEFGLWGGTGEISIAQVELKVVAENP